MSFGSIPSQIGNVTPLNPVGFLTPIGPRKINTVPLDVVIEETISHSVVVTEHPIEVGTSNGVSRGTISDNSYLAQTVYTMRGGVSDLPISWRLFRSDTLTGYANSNGTTRSISAYHILYRDHFLKQIPFTLQTPFGDLENMLFRSFTVHRDQSTKSSILFTAEMVQLQIVRPDEVSIAPVSSEDMIGDQAQTQAVGETDLGETALQAVP